MKAASLIPISNFRNVSALPNRECIPWHRTKAFRYALFFVIAMVLAFFCIHAFADGVDIGVGTTSDAEATAKGSGLTWAFLVAGVTSIWYYIYDRNMKHFVSLFVISLFSGLLFGHFLK